MESIIIILFVPFSGNVAFLGYLLTRNGRQLGKRPLLFWATLLPIASASFAISNFMNPGTFFFLALPFALAYALLGLVFASYVQTGAPTRHSRMLVLPFVGTTVLLLFVWTVTNFSFGRY